ncbi:hypothetical protein BS78_01G010200 [Paspalum vaginatum]|nr:hypothetical protein BS78_01G010200 [Paspalum vaginatum]
MYVGLSPQFIDRIHPSSPSCCSILNFYQYHYYSNSLLLNASLATTVVGGLDDPSTSGGWVVGGIKTTHRLLTSDPSLLPSVNLLAPPLISVHLAVRLHLLFDDE